MVFVLEDTHDAPAGDMSEAFAEDTNEGFAETATEDSSDAANGDPSEAATGDSSETANEDSSQAANEASSENMQETVPEESDETSGEKNLEAALEAILFAMGSSVELTRLADAIGKSTQETMDVIRSLMKRCEESDRGIRIIQLEDSLQHSNKKEYYDYLIRIAMHPAKPVMTDVMLETLSIIAYKQPVTKAEIEKIRGVKSDHAVNRLVEYDLVRELGRLDAPGRPILFGTTETFLRTFGVEAVGELPEIDPVRLADFRAEAEEEVRLEV